MLDVASCCRTVKIAGRENRLHLSTGSTAGRHIVGLRRPSWYPTPDPGTWCLCHGVGLCSASQEDERPSMPPQAPSCARPKCRFPRQTSDWWQPKGWLLYFFGGNRMENNPGSHNSTPRLSNYGICTKADFLALAVKSGAECYPTSGHLHAFYHFLNAQT